MMQQPGSVPGRNSRFKSHANPNLSPTPLEGTLFQPAAKQNQAIDAGVVAEARELLATEIRGVTFRDVLSALNGGSWVLCQSVTRENLDLTRRIAELSSNLSEQYRSQKRPETFKDKTLLLLSFGSRELSSTAFLKSISDINDLVTQMGERGLVTIRTEVISLGVSSSRFGMGTPTSAMIHTVAITPLGRAALHA